MRLSGATVMGVFQPVALVGRARDRPDPVRSRPHTEDHGRSCARRSRVPHRHARGQRRRGRSRAAGRTSSRPTGSRAEAHAGGSARARPPIRSRGAMPSPARAARARPALHAPSLHYGPAQRAAARARWISAQRRRHAQPYGRSRDVSIWQLSRRFGGSCDRPAGAVVPEARRRRDGPDRRSSRCWSACPLPG